MADSMSADERIALITKNLGEVLNIEILEDVIKKENRTPSIYWGTATTGRPHCGYFVPILKIAEFLAAGCHVKVLLADVHGFLDNLKAPLELVAHRAKYYEFCIKALLSAVNVPLEKLEFCLGRNHQLTPEYMLDFLKLSTVTTEHDCKRSGAEVVKQVSNPLLSGLIYPVMQALDEEYLKVDAQFGGVDQRKIFALAKDILPRVGYKERAHLMNPMVPGLQGGKMSASDPDSKIDLLDAPDVVRKKLKKAVATPKQVEENGVLSFVEYVLLPASTLRHGSPTFTVERRDADPLVYHDIAKMKEDYAADILTPQSLKPAVTEALITLLEPMQKAFKDSPEWQEIELKAYPPPPKEERKKKEKKDKGSRYPGAAKQQDQPVGDLQPANGLPSNATSEQMAEKVEGLKVAETNA